MVPWQQCRAATGDSGDQTVSAEELEAYNEYLKEKKEEDDLDWEALGQYEQLESYLHQLQKDKAAPHRALAASAGNKIETIRTPKKPGTNAAAAAVAGGVLPSARDALSKLSSGAEKQKNQGKAEKPKTSSRSGNRQAAAGRSQLDRDLDEMEELVAFLEVMQASGSGSGPRRPRGPTAASTDAGAAQDPGEKYLGGPIPLPDIESVGEEGRCRAFYDAPFALFVVDNSMQSSIEYVNAAAEGMFGSSYLELFGQPAHMLVAADMDAQADWAFAGRQIEASSAFSCKLPQLLLQNMSGGAVVGQDVTVWRVDSLESTPIGMAVLVQRWRPAAIPDKAKIDV
eukprot:gene11590-11734_t